MVTSRFKLGDLFLNFNAKGWDLHKGIENAKNSHRDLISVTHRQHPSSHQI